MITAAIVTAGGCATSITSAPSLTIAPSTVLLGDPVSVRAAGLAAGSQATLTASGVDGHGADWKASATFTVDSAGTIDPHRDRPASGSYDGVDPAGLFWSMRTMAGVAGSPFSTFSSLDISLDAAGATIASAPLAIITRQSLISTEVSGEVVGYFHVPAEQTARSPALIVLGGSEGGANSEWAALLASKLRVPVLALAYFGKPGLPPVLANIPLEYFQKAFAWLAAHPLVLKDRYLLVGASRGAELALQCAALFPGQVRAVAAQAPSGLRWQGDGRDPAPSWTWQGKALPYIPFRMSQEMERDFAAAMRTGTPYRASAIYEYSLQQASPAEREAASIPVELAQARVLVTGSGDDGVWPSARFATEIAARLAERHYAHPVLALNYPQAGHVLRPPYLPTTATVMANPKTALRAALGGNAAANAAAASDWWAKLIEFLATATEAARS